MLSFLVHDRRAQFFLRPYLDMARSLLGSVIACPAVMQLAVRTIFRIHAVRYDTRRGNLFGSTRPAFTHLRLIEGRQGNDTLKPVAIAANVVI